MGKKDWLIFPKVHSDLHNEVLENALIKKAAEIFNQPEAEKFKFFLLSGNFLGAFGFAYSALRQWPGAIRPETKKSSRRPVLDAQFACLAIYLSGLAAYQTDYDMAYEEIRDLLNTQGRPDLAEIVDEKLPFVSMPPKQMLREGQTPISPYYVIKNDEELVLGELYPSVQMTEIVESIRSRYFLFYSFEGYTAFGFFDDIPENARFGFSTTPKVFDGVPEEKSILDFIENKVETIKDLFSAFITVHTNSMLIQYMIEDYESLLTKILEYNMEEVS